MFVGRPLPIGSVAALLIGPVLSVLLAVRIVNEEELLAADLAGDDDDRRHVRHRLVPFTW